MKIQFTHSFEKDYQDLPGTIQKRIDKQLQFLSENPRHPSLRIKRIKGHPYIWEGRVTKAHRFTFQIAGGTFLLRRVGTHSILQTP